MQPTTVTDDAPSVLAILQDRVLIRDLILRTAMAIPTRDTAAFRAAFAPDSAIFGPDSGDESTAVDYAARAIGGGWDGRQQVVTNVVIDVHGDEATVSSRFIDAIAPDPSIPGGPATSLTGGRFLDRVVRTSDGWRIVERRIDVEWEASGDAGILAQFRAAGGTTADVVDRERAIAERRGALDEQALVDRQQISDQIARLARGVDRLDATVFATHFSDSMTMAFGATEVPGSTFVGMSSGDAPNRFATQHAVSNVVIAVEGDRAISSTHLFGVISYRPGFGPAFIKEENSATGGLMFSGCRYLDEWARVGAEWRLIRRDLVQEWTGRFDNSTMSDFAGSPAAVGTRDLSDPSYAALLPATPAADVDAVVARELIAEAVATAETGAPARHVLTENITVAGSNAVVEAYRLFARIGDDDTVRIEGGRELLTLERLDDRWQVTDVTLIPEWRTVVPKPDAV